VGLNAEKQKKKKKKKTKRELQMGETFSLFFFLHHQKVRNRVDGGKKAEKK